MNQLPSTRRELGYGADSWLGLLTRIILMTIGREIAEPRREASARNPENPMYTCAVRGGSEGRARWPEVCRSSG